MTGQTQDLALTRAAKGLTVVQLAARTGLNPRTIERIESGEVNPHPATRRALAQELGVSESELFSEREAA